MHNDVPGTPRDDEIHQMEKQLMRIPKNLAFQPSAGPLKIFPELVFG
jgi:hypothetical protein